MAAKTSATLESPSRRAPRVRSDEAQRLAAIRRHCAAEREARARAESWPGLSKDELRARFSGKGSGMSIDHWDLPPVKGGLSAYADPNRPYEPGSLHVRGFNGQDVEWEDETHGFSTWSTFALFEPVDGVFHTHLKFQNAPVIPVDHPLYEKLASWVGPEHPSQERPIAEIRGYLTEVVEPAPHLAEGELGYQPGKWFMDIKVTGDGVHSGGFTKPGWRGEVYIYRDVVPVGGGKFRRVWFGNQGEA